MGSAMCARLIHRGIPDVVWNRTAAHAEPVLDPGGQWASSPQEVAERSDIVLTMLSTPEVVEQVGKDIRSGLHRDGLRVDCSTISPKAARRLADLAILDGKVFSRHPYLEAFLRRRKGRCWSSWAEIPAITIVRRVFSVIWARTSTDSRAWNKRRT